MPQRPASSAPTDERPASSNPRYQVLYVLDGERRIENFGDAGRRSDPLANGRAKLAAQRRKRALEREGKASEISLWDTLRNPLSNLLRL